MRLLKTSALFSVSLIFFSCGLNNEYIDENITIEITSGTPEEPGIIEITSNIEDTILLRPIFITECSVTCYSIEGMRYREDLEKWVKGEVIVNCTQYFPPFILLPMETKSIEIRPVLPKNDYTIHMYYSVDNSPDFEPYTEVELWLRIK